MLAALMQLADTTIVNLSRSPRSNGALGASVDQGAWFITAYIIANVIVIPLSPWLQTLLGRKTYFALSIAGFTLTSVSALALRNDTTTLIALRFVQGAFGRRHDGAGAADHSRHVPAGEARGESVAVRAGLDSRPDDRPDPRRNSHR